MYLTKWVDLPSRLTGGCPKHVCEDGHGSVGDAGADVLASSLCVVRSVMLARWHATEVGSTPLMLGVSNGRRFDVG